MSGRKTFGPYYVFSTNIQISNFTKTIQWQSRRTWRSQQSLFEMFATRLKVTVRVYQFSSVHLNALHTHTLWTKPNNYLCWLWWSNEPGNDITAWAPHVRWKPLGPMAVLPTQQHCRYRCSHANTNLFDTKSTIAPSTVTNSTAFQFQLTNKFIPTSVRVTQRQAAHNN